MSDSDSSGDSPSDESPSNGSTPKRNALEWTLTTLGAVLVVGILGYLVYEWVAGATGPAELVITTGPPEIRHGTAEIPVEVRNEGARVAEAAVVEVCAGPDSCSEIHFDYVPFGSKVEGTVGLEAPLAGPVTTRMVSFRKP